MRYLRDTDTCIFAMRNHATVVQRMAAVAPGDCAVSTVTTFELLSGVRKCNDPAKERVKVNQLLSVVTEFSFDAPAAADAADIRAVLEASGQMIEPYDILLAGHARSLGLVLASANTREFSRVPNLIIEDWTSIAATP